MAELIDIENNKVDKRKFNGGKREGAGPKPLVDKLTKLEQAELKEMAKAEFWAEAFRDMAVPFVFQLVQDQEAGKGERLKAAELIINRFLGKPKERHELSGPDGEAIKHNLDPLSAQAREIALRYENELRNIQ